MPLEGPGDWGAWLHCILRAKEFVMHGEWEGVGVCVMWGSWGGGGGRSLCWGMREFLVSPTFPHPPLPGPHTPCHSWVPRSAA